MVYDTTYMTAAPRRCQAAEACHALERGRHDAVAWRTGPRQMGREKPGGPQGGSFHLVALELSPGPSLKCNTPGKMTDSLGVGSRANPGKSGAWSCCAPCFPKQAVLDCTGVQTYWGSLQVQRAAGNDGS